MMQMDAPGSALGFAALCFVGLLVWPIVWVVTLIRGSKRGINTPLSLAAAIATAVLVLASPLMLFAVAMLLGGHT